LKTLPLWGVWLGRLIGLVVNGPNVLLRWYGFNLGDILNAVKSLGRIVVGEVVLNLNAPQKLIEAVINYGLEPVIVRGRADIAFTAEAMKLIYNSMALLVLQLKASPTRHILYLLVSIL